MTLSSRQICSTRSIFRIIISLMLILVIVLAYKSMTHCRPSSDCYQLIKERSAAVQFLSKPPSLAQQRFQMEAQDVAYQAMFDEPAPPTGIDFSFAEQQETQPPASEHILHPRVKGAFVVLARNSELWALRSSMRYLEARFNHRYNYPWIFLNEQPFTEEFKNLTRMMTNAETHYGLIPEKQWSYPDFIDQDYAAERRQELEDRQIPYGGSESYRHMCRYQSGFFMLHPLLDGLDYYWRVEPGVKFSCEIEYDPFRVMAERDLKYGFTIALKEYRETIPSLWKTTLEFAKSHPQFIYPRSRPDSLLGLISDDHGWSYNLCHFWSNFEIASVKYMRSEGYQSYFKYLDETGGFFYERWGDAPVHSIAVALMLKRSDVHWFYDIGYKHDFFEHCPAEEKWLVNSKCYCDPQTTFDYNAGSCTPLFLDVMNATASSFVITQPNEEDL